MKHAILFIFLVILHVCLLAQSKDSTIIKDSTIRKDSVLIKPDSIARAVKAVPSPVKYDSLLGNIVKDHLYLNVTEEPVAMQNKVRTGSMQDFFFYLMAAIVFILAFLKFFYSRYFDNLFRVFFNTSLRQSQLTDQLLQAKLSSLFFNIFFVLTGGIFIYQLLRRYNWITDQNVIMALSLSVAAIAMIYFIKYLSLKFTGWLTGYKEATNTYLFIIFLINKIIGVFLVPVIIIMTFSSENLAKAITIIALLIIILLLILRFFRSYSLLQNQLKISRFHFLVYIAGVELLPLLLIYKSLVVLLSKNL